MDLCVCMCVCMYVCLSNYHFLPIQTDNTNWRMVVHAAIDGFSINSTDNKANSMYTHFLQPMAYHQGFELIRAVKMFC